MSGDTLVCSSLLGLAGVSALTELTSYGVQTVALIYAIPSLSAREAEPCRVTHPSQRLVAEQGLELGRLICRLVFLLFRLWSSK